MVMHQMQKSRRVPFVTLHYELCILLAIEARVTRNWADMLSRLINVKPGARRKLECADLCLPWRPLRRELARELHSPAACLCSHSVRFYVLQRRWPAAEDAQIRTERTGVAQKKATTSASHAGEKTAAGASVAYAAAAEGFSNVLSNAAQSLSQLLEENVAPYLREWPRTHRTSEG
jgi:hypothetical protein